MKKNKLLFAVALLTIPLLAWAAEPTGGLVPQWCQAGCPCSLCDLYTLADNIIGFLLYIVAIPIAAGSFLYGGVLMLTSGGNSSQITKGRGVMTNAIVGMTLAFFAWAIFNTILSTIGFGIKGASWYNIPPCDRGGGETTCNIKLSPKPEEEVPSGPPPVDYGPTLSHDEARDYLRDAGVDIKSSQNCEDNRRGCTYLGGLSLEAIGNIIAVDAGCGGCVTITGGTEPGHSSHGPNFPATVDMSYSSSAVLSLSANGVRKDANFGKGFTCERSPGEAVPCDSGNIHHIHVEF